MKRLEVAKTLLDIDRACRAIESFTRGKSLSDYKRDFMLRSAVERQFEIAGEAISRLSRIDEALTQRIRDHARIISFRNRLIHGYDSIDDEVVWGVIEKNLPLLLADLADIHREHGQG